MLKGRECEEPEGCEEEQLQTERMKRPIAARGATTYAGVVKEQEEK